MGHSNLTLHFENPQLVETKFQKFDFLPFSCEIYHFGTAEEVGDELRFNCVCFDEKMTMDFIQRMWLGNTDVSPGHLFHVTLKL